jgi:hypothetical protein
MSKPADPLFQVTDVQTLAGSFSIRFICRGDHSQRASALADFEREVRHLYGKRALTLFSSTQEKTLGYLDLPGGAAPDFRDLAGVISGLARSAGLRAFVLPVLNAELRHRLLVPSSADHNAYNGGVTGYLRATAAIQAHWAGALAHYLALDAAGGSCAHPDLIYELHVGRPPLEHLLLRNLLADQHTARRGQQTSLVYQAGLHFGDVPTLELTSALVGLTDARWVELVRFDPALTCFFAARGPLLRQLSSRFLLELPV